MENKRFPTLLGTWKNHHLLWPKILYDCTQNLVRLRIYKTLTRTREVKQGFDPFEGLKGREGLLLGFRE